MNIDLTKYERWVPPTVPTIFDPPVKLINEQGHSFTLLSFDPRDSHPYNGIQFSFPASECFYIKKSAPPPKRMTNLELAEFLNKGGWQVKGLGWSDGMIYTFNSYTEKDDEIVLSSCRIRKFGTTEWIEPTTDLLEPK